ncbi:MAG: iron donor protein CyaY [Pseudomonadota bacterium]
MNESEFNTTVDRLLLAIEDALETQDADIDMETTAGILTLTFSNGSKVIINRQSAMREVWVAARSGGFHLGRKETGWFCSSSGETLPELLSRVCSEQAGQRVSIAL